MKKGFLQRFLVIVFVLILCVLFTGCTKVVEGILEDNHDEKADAYLEKMIDAILQNDADAAYALFCDGVITYAEICAGLEGIRTDCDGLSAVTLPDSVTSIGEGAFFWCKSLSTVFYRTSNASKWGSIEIGDGNEDLEGATLLVEQK